MMRVIANLASILAIAILPWWGAALVLLVLLAVFDFLEIIIYGIILSILYGAPGGMISSYGFFFASIILYLISVYIRPYLREV